MKKILKIGVWVLLVVAPTSFSSFAETYPDLRIPTALNEIPRPDVETPAAAPQEAPQQQAAVPQNLEQQPAFPAPAQEVLPENQPDAVAMQQQPAQNPQPIPTEKLNLQAAAAPESAPEYQPQAPLKAVEATPEVSSDYSGIASYYGDEFQGRPTASGETFDMNKLTAAHRALPFGSVVEVTNVNNGRQVQVIINDRGPFIKNRVIDLSYKAADTIDMIPAGIAPVNLRVISMGTGERTVPQAPQPVWTAEAPTEIYPANNYVAQPALEAAPLRAIAIQENVPGNKIQVVSFSVKQSALKTADFLASRGFSTVIEQARPFGQTVYRVIIPIESVQAATDIRRALGDAGFTDVLLRRS